MLRVPGWTPIRWLHSLPLQSCFNLVAASLQAGHLWCTLLAESFKRLRKRDHLRSCGGLNFKVQILFSLRSCTEKIFLPALWHWGLEALCWFCLLCHCANFSIWCSQWSGSQTGCLVFGTPSKVRNKLWGTCTLFWMHHWTCEIKSKSYDTLVWGLGSSLRWIGYYIHHVGGVPEGMCISVCAIHFCSAEQRI